METPYVPKECEAAESYTSDEADNCPCQRKHVIEVQGSESGHPDASHLNIKEMHWNGDVGLEQTTESILVGPLCQQYREVSYRSLHHKMPLRVLDNGRTRLTNPFPRKTGSPDCTEALTIQGTSLV